MRLTVVTNNKMISLGILAKDYFAKNVLVNDENGTSFDVLQTVQKNTLKKIQNLEPMYGIDQKIKEGIINAFSEIKVGDKFLCIDAWVIDYKSDEARFYWEVQRLCNKGETLKRAIELGNEWLKKYRKNKIFIQLTKGQEEDIKKFIAENNYTFSVIHVKEEYLKYKEYEYVSNSFKKVFEKFDEIFVRNGENN